MAEASYPDWAAWLAARMSPKINIHSLHKATNIPEPTLRSYKAGQRKPEDPEKIQLLAAKLKLPNESAADAAESLRRSLQRRTAGDFNQKLDSENAALRIMTLHYHPFANGKDQFVDRLFERFFRLCVIQRQQPPGAKVGFQLRKRLDMLYSGEYDIATNFLGTLHRLKLLRFYWIPIRVSLGAVCLRRHARSLLHISEALAFKNRRRSILWPIVIDLEVGAVHVQQTLELDLSDDHFVEDLDPGKLAARLREQDPIVSGIACTVTDEVTALAVARELGDDALIVFPLSTSQSVQTSRVRREMPAHVLGAAISRKNRELRDYLDDAWSAMLRWEVETTSSSYARLFSELTEYVGDCLKAGPVIADDLRGTVDLRELVKDDPEGKELFVYRMARAYARRALQIDQRSMESFQRGNSAWRDILERAREKTLVEEAEDRHFVRKRVVFTVQEAFGEYTPKLLKENIVHLTPLLEQEFDIRLVEPIPATVEALTSFIQRTMEQSSIVALQTTTIEAEPDQAEILKTMRGELSVVLSDTGPDEEDAPGPEGVSILAVYRGKFVGCIELFPGPDCFRLRNLYVRHHFRKNGIGRLLLREAIKSASKRKVIRVDLTRVPASGETDDIVGFFERNGFRQGPGTDGLMYSLM